MAGQARRCGTGGPQFTQIGHHTLPLYGMRLKGIVGRQGVGWAGTGTEANYLVKSTSVASSWFLSDGQREVERP